MSIKIHRLETENVKRIKAIKVEPTPAGLTIVGGRNNQGKTSVLDSIAWALGGDRFRPSDAKREDSIIPPYLRVVLSNGLIVERKGKNSELKVTDPDGKKAGQQILNEFVEQLALDLPKFMQSSSKEKANILLQIIGVGHELTQLESQERQLYNKRLAIGQIADQKKKFSEEIPYHKDAPNEMISASELIRQQQDILARNGENQRKRENLKKINDIVLSLSAQIIELQGQLKSAMLDLEVAQKSALDLQDESTAELEENIRNIEVINQKVRYNIDKDKAEEDAKGYEDQYKALTVEIDTVRKAKTDLLNNASLPLPGLSVVDGELTYNGRQWDCMSGADQLKVSVAIVRKLNPKCGFILLDKLEQMDLDTLKQFGEWLEQEGLQAIATRVSTGDECSIIIEDGYVVGESLENTDKNSSWKAGEF